MEGECVNAFCLTRPPGHHAGRDVHAMKAVSNGFCLLNSAACAALYATSPVSEGGPGLKRVCVIDIDVHHGNGTQDILCSTYDPRFLYVSIHAGGSDANGLEPSREATEQFNHHLAITPKKGIFPGRCGDNSPHQGVLNIPLGTRVTSHGLGAALVSKVTPAVEKFSPELIIISTGFDAHRNDPLGLGGLSAEDFGTLTEVICKLAHRSCSGRVLSVLEGGYGVPCCRLPKNFFEPDGAKNWAEASSSDKKIRDTSSCEEKTSLGSNDVEKPADGALDTPRPLPAISKSEESTTEPEIDSRKIDQPNGPKEPISNGDEGTTNETVNNIMTVSSTKVEPPMKPLEIMDLGDSLPENMKDDMPYGLMKRLDKCHAEGFVDCVREHVSTLAKCNFRN